MVIMEHLFIPYELAKLAKEKGFNDHCLYFYNKIHYPGRLMSNINGCLNSDYKGEMGNHIIMAPIYQQIIDWLDSKGVFVRDSHCKIDYDDPDGDDLNDRPKVRTWEYHITQIDEGKKFHFSHRAAGYGFKTKYEALNKAIEEAFKLI